ncbi:MAG: ATP-binding protein [Pseudomonadota bacterium]
MDGTAPNPDYLIERRRRLAAEQMLDRTRKELRAAHAALVSNADRLSRRYLSEREQNLKLSDRQRQVLAQRKDAADKADRARRRLWHALEAMRDGFALFNPNGQLVAANHTYLSLFDAAGEIAPGISAEDMFALAAEEGAFDIGSSDPKTWAAQQIARWSGERIPPITLTLFDGRIMRLQDRRAPDGDLVSLAVDISEDRAREAALAEARDAATGAARAKSEFLARMGHELRTPMNGILGLSDLLCAEESLGLDLRQNARTIRDSAEALLTIINDTLDVSRLEAGRMELRQAPFDLEAMLCDCIRLVTPTAAAGVQVGLSWPLTLPTHWIGDAGRIRQVVTNLLGNALKVTEAGQVILSARPSETGLDLSVRDTGPGIPKARQDSIFQPFAQLGEPGVAPRDGTGLGLTISRGLAERMEGSLTVQSAPGEGACFTFSLPLVAESAAPDLTGLGRVALGGPSLALDLLAEGLEAAGVAISRDPEADATAVLLPARSDIAAVPPNARVILLGQRAAAGPEALARADAILPDPPSTADLIAAIAGQRRPAAPVADKTGQARLLLADDNATNRFLLTRLLRDEPFDVTIVEDGRQAVDAYIEDRPDIVILDISMPVLDGMAAAREIRAFEAARGGTPAPLVSLTAHAGGDIDAELTDAGFIDHMTKPVRKDDLMDAIARNLQSNVS